MGNKLREYLKVLDKAIQEYYEIAAQNLGLGLADMYNYWRGVAEGTVRTRKDLINLIGGKSND